MEILVRWTTKTNLTSMFEGATSFNSMKLETKAQQLCYWYSKMFAFNTSSQDGMYPP